MHESEHPPSAQTNPGSHFIPHDPQFAGSAWMSAHFIPQTTAPPPHCALHAPIAQTSPFVESHDFPHAPQFPGSRVVSTHWLLHG